MKTLSPTVLSLAVLTLASAANAQTNIDVTNKFAWCENVGWTNWRNAGTPTGSQGALIAGSFLSGFIWSENAGYFNLGDGTPTGGSAYANLNSSDFGVNILGDSRLGGLAWGENTGWMNFGPFASLASTQQARFDPASRRLRGYAWGENIGWVNLDDAVHFVGIRCPADFNDDGAIDFFDYLDFVDDFSANLTTADFNLDGSIDFFDYLDFVDAFSIGC